MMFAWGRHRFLHFQDISTTQSKKALSLFKAKDMADAFDSYDRARTHGDQARQSGMMTPNALDARDRKHLREFLEQRFSLEELKNIAFDLGVWPDRLHHETTLEMSRDLVQYFEQRGILNNLITEVLKRRPAHDLAELSAKLPPSEPRTKVQIIMGQGVPFNRSEIIESIAALLGLDVEQVDLIGAAWGSLRLLLGLPQRSAHRLVELEVHKLEASWHSTIAITPFDSLDSINQGTWRTIALSGALQPVSWSMAIRANTSSSLGEQLRAGEGLPTSLSIPRLFRLIDIDHVNPEIIVRCKEALHWLHRGEVSKAVNLARTAARLAAGMRNIDKRDISAEDNRRTTVGIALLYLAYVRHLSEIKRERARTLLTGQSALTWLADDDYHRAIAELVLARLAWEEDQLEAAVAHYQAALPILNKTILRQHRRDNQFLEKKFSDLKRAAQKAARNLPLANILPESPINHTEVSQKSTWLSGVPIPSELVWTGTSPSGLKLSPEQTTEPGITIPARRIESLSGDLEYIESERLSINGQLYQILYPEVLPGGFRLLTNQLYYAFQLATAREQQNLGQPCYVLALQYDLDLPPDLPIVIHTPAQKRAWLVDSQADTWPHIIDERRWTIVDDTGSYTYLESEIQIVGVAVAILTYSGPVSYNSVY